MRGLTAAGLYLPRYRLSAEELEDAWGTTHATGIDQKAVPNADEDALTMATAASERALGAAEVGRDSISLLAVATTTPPLEESDVTGRLVRTLGLSTDVRTAVSTQHTAAGADVLASALDADGPALVAVADCPEGEPADEDHSLGAGAAAFVVDEDPAVEIREIGWHADEAPGVRFRRRGEGTVESLGITTFERDVVRDAITGAAADLDGVDSVDRAAVHQPNGKLPYRIVGDLPVDNEAVHAGMVVDRIGDAGAATVPIGLLSALAAADGERSLAAFFGGGTAAAFVCEGGLPVAGIDDLEDGTELSYADYLRERGYVVSGEVAGGGANVSLPNWRRSLDQRYRLVAGRCPECGAVSFPPDGACQSCHARVDFERFEASQRGTILALTTIGQGGAPPEFAEQQQRDGAYGVAIVELGDGRDAIQLPGQLTDADLDDASVGDEVRATIRRIYVQEGIPRYGVKFTLDG